MSSFHVFFRLNLSVYVIQTRQTDHNHNHSLFEPKTYPGTPTEGDLALKRRKPENLARVKAGAGERGCTLLGDQGETCSEAYRDPEVYGEFTSADARFESNHEAELRDLQEQYADSLAFANSKWAIRKLEVEQERKKTQDEQEEREREPEPQPLMPKLWAMRAEVPNLHVRTAPGNQFMPT
ncbi:hypothetical protein B0O99DRAFT_590296 [Bisporella sp. PMI_857]|nr:hypothetical protein B0O99DRAFT_590296 [Bisporella sp. PMI_857]